MIHLRHFPQLALVLAAGIAGAHQTGDPGPVPEREYGIAREQGAEGPTETRGIESVVALGSIGLGEDFAALEGRVLRARELTILPGGVVAVHQHDSRPGVAYILEGTMTEHRNDAEGPIERGPGKVAFEKTGVTHWWSNDTEHPARALVVDIVPAED